ncbi:MAG: CrcB family protein [Bacteroidales bacterium]|nr:CrcB family protein [Bacteroidales bacterium]
MLLKEFLLVGLGGAVGSMLRYGISLTTGLMELSPAVGTLFVNGIGSLVIGIVLAVCEQSTWYLFLAIGLCGGFTTFSTFSAQTLDFFQTGKIAAGIVYLFVTLLLCLFFVWLGLSFGGKLFK